MLFEFDFEFEEIFAIFDRLPATVYDGESRPPFATPCISLVGSYKFINYVQKLWSAIEYGELRLPYV